MFSIEHLTSSPKRFLIIKNLTMRHWIIRGPLHTAFKNLMTPRFDYIDLYPWAINVDFFFFWNPPFPHWITATILFFWLVAQIGYCQADPPWEHSTLQVSPTNYWPRVSRIPIPTTWIVYFFFISLRSWNPDSSNMTWITTVVNSESLFFL